MLKLSINNNYLVFKLWKRHIWSWIFNVIGKHFIQWHQLWNLSLQDYTEQYVLVWQSADFPFEAFVDKKDAFAKLPTRFDKSWIYELASLVARKMEHSVKPVFCCSYWLSIKYNQGLFFFSDHLYEIENELRTFANWSGNARLTFC